MSTVYLSVFFIANFQYTCVVCASGCISLYSVYIRTFLTTYIYRVRALIFRWSDQTSAFDHHLKDLPQPYRSTAGACRSDSSERSPRASRGRAGARPRHCTSKHSNPATMFGHDCRQEKDGWRRFLRQLRQHNDCGIYIFCAKTRFRCFSPRLY